MSNEYFHVQLRQEVQVALPVSAAVEVMERSPEALCPIPGVDPVLLGVTNWRGSLLWNVDLSDFLGVKKDTVQSLQPLATRSVVVIGDGRSQRRLGCWVKRLLGIISLTEQQINPVPKQFPPSVIPYAAGWVKFELPLVVLDPFDILNASRWQEEISLDKVSI